MQEKERREAEHDRLDAEVSRLDRRLGSLNTELATHEAALGRIVITDESTLLDEIGQKALDAAVHDASPGPATLQDCDRWENAVREQLRAARTTAEKTRSDNSSRIVKAMAAYNVHWSQHCHEIEIGSVESRHELIRRLELLVRDDLPAYEAKFRELLQQKTIQQITVFHRRLDDVATTIRKRIDVINASLAKIDYTDTTYIAITVENTRESSIGEFRREMREITETTVIGDADDAYSEQRFLKVRALLDRFRGRENYSTEDKRWTERVTDVRNWYTYGAVELRRHDDSQVESYSDSDGKSGGQKEKLAYTMLAASLAYQYGLADGRENTFRLVMVDEAFGRGSEKSAQYGMSLFQQLGLQVLVATPLGKIRTIEKYVRAVGFVEQDDETKKSRVSSMTVEVWRSEVGRAALYGAIEHEQTQNLRIPENVALAEYETVSRVG